MSLVTAAAAFARGAARSPAAEPWKAALHPSAHLLTYHLDAPCRRHLSCFYGNSASPADAARRRLTLARYAYTTLEHGSGCGWNSGRRNNPVPALHDPDQTRSTASSALRRSNESAAYSDVPNPNLRKLMKMSLLCVLLQRMGRLPPPPKDDKATTMRNLALLVLGLGVGYMAAKDNKKMAFVLKVCDGSMKGYKLFSELATLIIVLISAFFK